MNVPDPVCLQTIGSLAEASCIKPSQDGRDDEPPGGPAGHALGTQTPNLFNFTLGTKKSQLKYKQKSRELDLFFENKILSMWKILIYVQTTGGLLID